MRRASLVFGTIVAIALFSSIPIIQSAACVPAYFGVFYANENDQITSAPTNYGYTDMSALLVPNGILNVTLNTSPSYPDSSTSPAAGQYGLFLIYVGAKYNLTTYNRNGFVSSPSNFVATPNVYITGTSATTPSYPYSFANSQYFVNSSQPLIFGNGNNVARGYLITFGFVVPDLNGNGCTPTTYYVSLFNPATISYASYPTAGVNGDPQFSGLRGQSYQVHGIDGAVYNIISDVDAQVNSRFVFLTGPRKCPLMPSTGRKSSACFAHAGSYLGEIGVKNSKGDRLFIAAGPATSGFKAVTLNGEDLKVGYSSDLVNVTSTHEISVSVGSFLIKLENSDDFVNLASVHTLSNKLQSHGLLGQTWRNKRYSGLVKEIEGEVDDYVIDEDCVFGDSFLYNKYK